MRNNAAFLRLVDYIDANGISKAQILAASDERILEEMFPPDGERPSDDHTTVPAALECLKHIYRERKQATRVQNFIDKLKADHPDIVVAAVGDGQYLVTIGDGDE